MGAEDLPVLVDDHLDEPVVGSAGSIAHGVSLGDRRVMVDRDQDLVALGDGLALGHPREGHRGIENDRRLFQHPAVI